MIAESIEVAAAPDRVFRAWVEEIDAWWPRRGTYRYSFAPESTEPDSIRFEPQPGGRFFERFADGTEFEIGRIVRWEPPHRLTYTWRAPGWRDDSTVDVAFVALPEGRTRVELTHTDLAAPIEDGYATGVREILAAFATAMHAEETT